MKIAVDKNVCIGCGTCVGICPDVFEIGKDGKSQVKSQKNLPCVEEAKNACPTGAIKVSK